MRILIAPDKFKGSLTAFEAAEAMRDGALRAHPDFGIDLCPLSDGGEGFVAVALAAASGQRRVSCVTGPAGASVEAPWAMLKDGTAILESAAVIGSSLANERRGPSECTTYGVGELLIHAIDAGASTVVIGVGGTATNDGGIGMAQALGVRFAGGGRPLRGHDLASLVALDTSRRDARLRQIAILGVTDVDNPLTGPDGAAHVYGPQKGARADEVIRLDEGLMHLAALCGDSGEQPGDGAGGGLGYGLRLFAGARLARGSSWILDLVRFDERVAGCDLVLTGEGRLDEQSARGKVVAAVGRHCKARGIPVVAIAGSVRLSEKAQTELGLARSVALGSERRHAFHEARGLLERSTERFLRYHTMTS